MFFIILLFFSTFLYSSEPSDKKECQSKTSKALAKIPFHVKIFFALLDQELAQKLHTKLYHNKEFNKDRTVQSEIKLLQTYQQHQNPLFDPQRLEELHQRAQAIELHFYMLKNSQCPQSKEFLTLARDNNELTKKQKKLFLELLEQEKEPAQTPPVSTPTPTVSTTTPTTSYHPMILLVLFFFITHQMMAY